MQLGFVITFRADIICLQETFYLPPVILTCKEKPYTALIILPVVATVFL